MTIGTWQLIALLVILSPTIIAFFCCLFLINKKSYTKLPKGLAFAGFWYRLIAGVIDTCWYILLTIMATSNVALRYLKSKSDILQKLLGFIFIMIGMVLILDLYLTFYK